MSNVVAIIQARMGSQRLPGKVMEPIEGKPMLQRVVERANRARELDAVVVATSIDKIDNCIADLCEYLDYNYHRGSREDVLSRYYECARIWKADAIVRITGDCPLTEPEIIEKVLEVYLSWGTQYISNVDPPTYPDGCDVEVFTMGALEHAWGQAKLPSDKEHVTPWMRHNLPHGNISHPIDLSQYRLCVDAQADLDVVRAIYAELGDNPHWLDAVDLLKAHPDIAALNAGIRRNEGMEKSVREDEGLGNTLTQGPSYYFMPPNGVSRSLSKNGQPGEGTFFGR